MHKDQAASAVTPPDWPTILHGWAIRYLGRYASSTAQLERVLKRKINNRPDLDPSGATKAIAPLISKLTDAGYLDDAGYAKGMCLSLIRSGRSTARIKQKLQEKGVDADLIDKGLEDARTRLGLSSPKDQALIGALIILRKRGMGPFTRADREEKPFEKVMGILARAGYGYDIAKQALSCSYEEAKEILETIA